jgi:hypothetical protein
MSNRLTTEAATRAILRGMARDARAGRVHVDGGLDWQRLRMEAFRCFVVSPALSAADSCVRFLARTVRAWRSPIGSPR